MKKALALILALVMILSFAACGKTDDGNKPASTTASSNDIVTTEPETTVIKPDIPDTDWEGKAFRVLGDQGSKYPQFGNFEILTEELNGEVYNDALFNRNGDLSKQYNVTFEQYLDPSEHHTQTLIQQMVAAGEDLYDLVFVDLNRIGSCAQNGYFLNMNNIKYIDFDKPWWNPGVNESVSIGGKVYFTSSDYSLRDKNRAYILVYNPQFAEDNKIPDLVPTIREGKWTIDLMIEYNEIVSKDIDGDGVMSDQDHWGVTMDSYNSMNAFWYSCDNICMAKNSSGAFEIAINTQHNVDSIEKCIKALCNEKTGGFCDDMAGKVSYDKWSFSGTVFNEGRALFTTCFPHSLKSKSENCDFEYTVIPFPKFDENQEQYLTMPDVMTMLFAVPVTTQTPDFTGFMLEALSYASTETTLKAYLEITCKSKYSANQISTEMLDVTFAGIRYDIDSIYSLGLYNLIYSIAKYKENTFASMFASEKQYAQQKLDTLVETLDKLEY